MKKERKDELISDEKRLKLISVWEKQADADRERKKHFINRKDY